jgi:hypothetical protein
MAMKKFILIISSFCFLSFYVSAKTYIQQIPASISDTLPTGELIQFLKQININSYYGKPVDTFMSAVPAIPYELKVYGGDHSRDALFQASYLRYTYSGGLVIRIHVREYKNMKRYSSSATWDVNLFRKERIYKIEVYSDHDCINGSCK